MSEETNKAYVAKKDPTEGIYNDLYLEGIELLQKLSSDEWTDYNEHDPGVTILENLSYTLTSLSYKTQIPIKNILRESKGEKLQSGDNGFFVASEILTTNPVTLNDFRKVFIDKITNVKNVWVTTEDIVTEKLQNGTQSSLKGLFHIAVEVYDYPTDQEEISNEKERIIKEVENLFHASRNLCEDLYKVEVLEPYQLQLKLKLTLDSEVVADEVFANVYFAVNNYITHEVRFFSLWDLQSEKVNINTIFNGPLLENGFIPDSELKDRVSQITPSEVIKLISDIEGVISVDYFLMSNNNESQSDSSTPMETAPIKIPDNTTPILSFPVTNVDWVSQSNGVTFSPDLNEVQKQLAYIKAMNYGNFKSVSQAINTLGIPEGENLEISSYYPIREQFPQVYGIGGYGLQKGLPAIRYAQANQLKAYLLPFDQLMADFLSQLTHLYNIYDVHGKEIQSYFYQELEDMPQLLQLIKRNDFLSDEEVLKEWGETLEKLNTRFDRNALERLNVVANSLLARYSEEFPVYALKNINEGAYGKKVNDDDDDDDDDDEFERRLLYLKRKLISNYGYLSYYRAKSFDYTQRVTSIKNISEETEKKLAPPIIEKTSILLGIKNFGLGPIYEIMANSGLKIYTKDEGMEILSQILEVVFPNENSSTLAFDEIIIINDEVLDLFGSFYFLGKHNCILKDIMKHGVLLKNYQIKESTIGGKVIYNVLFSQNEKTSVIHISESITQAESAIQKAIRFLVELSARCEGIYLLEHLLLAPPYQNNHYGFSITLAFDKGSYKFSQMALKCYRSRDEELNSLIRKLDKNDVVLCKVDGANGKYHLQILNEDGLPWAKSTKVYHDKEAAEKAITTLSNNLILNQNGSSVVEINYYAHYGRHRVDETFFSFQMSFILPSWPVRFQDTNFRIKFNNVVKEQVPVHTAYYQYWIDLDQMITFEKSYYNWLTLLLNDRTGHDYLDACYDLIVKLKGYKNKTEL
ncbi:MAG: hypothetical protein V3U92_01235 [Cellulophaga sp.]